MAGCCLPNSFLMIRVTIHAVGVWDPSLGHQRYITSQIYRTTNGDVCPYRKFYSSYKVAFPVSGAIVVQMGYYAVEI